jgi:hypothetical protein
MTIRAVRPPGGAAALLAWTIAALIAAQVPAFAGISPSQLDINLGPFPVDLYLSANNACAPNCPSPPGMSPAYNQYYIPAVCSATSTIQSCVKNWFTGSGGYVSQGVTGVRLYFALGGGNWSTAWDSNGNVQSGWVSKFLQLMKDLKSYGIQRVTPTTMLVDDWSGTPIIPNPPVYSNCNTTKQLMFFKWVPFGEIYDPNAPPNANDTGFPDCQGARNGYSNANANPYFWGWTPYFNAVSAILQQVAAAGLQIADFELVNEIDLTDFTVEGRLVWDNKHGSSQCNDGSYGCTDVLSGVRYYLSQYGFDPHRADYSVGIYRPIYDSRYPSGYDCGSVYGDSAMLLHQSSLLGAIAGPNGLFGPTSPAYYDSLPCSGSTSQMISLPVSYLLYQPTSTDLHAEPCYVLSTGGCDTSHDGTSPAKNFFSDVWSLLTYRNLAANYVVFGETFPNQPTEVYGGNFTQTGASQMVAGYLQSTLYANHAASVTFRPFENPVYNSPYCLGGTLPSCTGGTWIAQYTQIPVQLHPPF